MSLLGNSCDHRRVADNASDCQYESDFDTSPLTYDLDEAFSDIVEGDNR
jgi:hypothetical protein